MDNWNAYILTYGVQLKRRVCLSHRSVRRVNVAMASASTFPVCSFVDQWLVRSRCTDYRLGHPCPEKNDHTMDCITQMEPDILFECLTHEQICDDKHQCVNGEDLLERRQ